MTYFTRANSSRRLFLSQAIAAAATIVPAAAVAHGPRQNLRPITLGFSLYGMKSLPLRDALKVCREIGYDGFELPVMADWPCDATRLTAEGRRELRRQVGDSGLRLSAMMENLVLMAEDARHRENLDRLKLAGELAHELAPDRPPPIQTVLGGRPSQWPMVREQMAARLRDWAAIAEKSKFVLAIKAHVSGALHRPEDAVWLVRQAATDSVKLAFDYSHFALQGLTLDDCLHTMLPLTVFVHVKDAAGDAEKPRFLLPGQGKTDYQDYLKKLAERQYAGDVMVEVSSQISSRPDYDAVAAAKSSFAVLDAARNKIPTQP